MPVRRQNGAPSTADSISGRNHAAPLAREGRVVGLASDDHLRRTPQLPLDFRLRPDRDAVVAGQMAAAGAAVLVAVGAGTRGNVRAGRRQHAARAGS